MKTNSSIYPGLFSRFNRHGKAWLKSVDAETRKIFSEIGLAQLRAAGKNISFIGGSARAKSSKHDSRG